MFDGLGRVQKSTTLETYLGVDSSVSVETQYDALGRAWRISNPFRGAGASAWTQSVFDVLDRPLMVTATDGTVTRYKYTNHEVLVRDPANKWMKRVSDGLGRLKEVVEDPAGTIDTFTNSIPLSFSTLYTYDVRDQLLGVMQGGRDRSFTYDALGRLLTAVSPELGAEVSPSGVQSYSYDPAGNLITRNAPRNATTSLIYDLRERVKKKTYGGVLTPEVVYCYDGDVSGDCAGGPAGAGFNRKGRLTRVKNSESTTDYSEYDAMGRILKSQQTTVGQAA